MTKDTQTTSTLPPRQKEILYTLYRFRFLTHIHIQHLLHHKQFTCIYAWLNDLTITGYIKRYDNAKPVTFLLMTYKKVQTEILNNATIWNTVPEE